MREITLQELAALAENAKGEIRRIYLHWTAGHYNNTYDDYHLNITGDGTVWSSCGKLTEYKEHTWHRNSGAVAVSICCCADAVAYADGGVDFGSVPPTRQQLETLARVVAVLCRGLDLPIDDNYVMTRSQKRLTLMIMGRQRLLKDGICGSWHLPTELCKMAVL